jgi:mono/diheme cytochrome c family protein
MLLLLVTLLPLAAAADPFPKGDALSGRKLHDAKCIACHQRLVGGDGSDIYTRIDRKIQTPKALLQRIAACNAQVNAGWFPEDEEHAAAYLNRQYYKFR